MEVRALHQASALGMDRASLASTQVAVIAREGWAMPRSEG